MASRRLRSLRLDVIVKPRMFASGTPSSDATLLFTVADMDVPGENEDEVVYVNATDSVYVLAALGSGVGTFDGAGTGSFDGTDVGGFV